MTLSLIVIFLCLFFYITKGGQFAYAIFFGMYLIGCAFPIIGPITAENIICLVFLFTHAKDIIQHLRTNKYPLIVGTILCLLSTIISSIFAKGNPHWGTTISQSLSMYLMPILFFYYVDTEEDLNRILKIIGIIVLGTAFLAMIDIITGQCVYNDFISSILGRDYGWNRSGEYRFGSIQRLQTFFTQPITYGFFCVTTLSFYLFFFYKEQNLFNIDIPHLGILILILIAGCFLSASRSAIVPLLLCLAFYYRKIIFTPGGLLAIPIILLIFYFSAADYLWQIYDAIVNSDEVAMGSTADMRESQWEIALAYWKQSPIIGMGNHAIMDYVKEEMEENMYGAESIWFSLLVDYGIFGCISYLALYLESFLCMKEYKLEILMFLGIQLLVHSLTTTPGMNIGHMLCLVLLLYKYKELNLTSNEDKL